MTATDPLLAVQDVVKNYQALRPLRIASLALTRGDVISVSGLDAAAAEMLVGLLTGALLPDTGDIQLFGRSTREVNDSEAWLALLDGVGIITDRAVLIGQFSAEQNIAMSFTLDVDPLVADVRPRVAALAEEVGLRSDMLASRIAEAPPEVSARVRVGRALALDPSVLLAEHPSATLPREAVKAFGADINRVARARNLAVLAVTADEAFASALGGRLLTHDPVSGSLRVASAWTRLFRRS
jgi:ABC-type lipoprotein export system ATPase subunit